ncbi:four helix bundle protein [Hyphococcus sp.]|uniref:four helix bundle protein n=1 Tax=Hyphococcus sp. TaxID=2038636 RepID=UPI003CCB80DA
MAGQDKVNRVQSFQDLDVWKMSIDLAETIYRASGAWPKEERFGLTQQIRRAAASISANIAEGAARNGTREFLHFLGIAKGSLAETRTFLVLAERLDYLDAAAAQALILKAEDISRMLAGLTKSLQARVSEK